MDYDTSRTGELLDAAAARVGGKLDVKNTPLEIKAIAILVCQMQIARCLGPKMLDPSTEEGDARRKFDLMTALLCPELRLDPAGKEIYKNVTDMMLRDLADLTGK